MEVSIFFTRIFKFTLPQFRLFGALWPWVTHLGQCLQFFYARDLENLKEKNKILRRVWVECLRLDCWNDLTRSSLLVTSRSIFLLCKSKQKEMLAFCKYSFPPRMCHMSDVPCVCTWGATRVIRLPPRLFAVFHCRALLESWIIFAFSYPSWPCSLCWDRGIPCSDGKLPRSLSYMCYWHFTLLLLLWHELFALPCGCLPLSTLIFALWAHGWSLAAPCSLQNLVRMFGRCCFEGWPLCMSAKNFVVKSLHNEVIKINSEYAG